MAIGSSLTIFQELSHPEIATCVLTDVKVELESCDGDDEDIGSDKQHAWGANDGTANSKYFSKPLPSVESRESLPFRQMFLMRYLPE